MLKNKKRKAAAEELKKKQKNIAKMEDSPVEGAKQDLSAAEESKLKDFEEEVEEPKLFLIDFTKPTFPEVDAIIKEI